MSVQDTIILYFSGNNGDIYVFYLVLMCILEERYIWVLAPGDRGGHVGEHYLVVRPIVEAGVKSVNASVSVTSIAAQCKYWNESQSAWSEAGCRVSTSHLMSNSQSKQYWSNSDG